MVADKDGHAKLDFDEFAMMVLNTHQFPGHESQRRLSELPTNVAPHLASDEWEIFILGLFYLLGDSCS
ncbi:hypothetical protein GYMLUDRAFT_48823 [Collybiopsis luxurians FD-317 M1]|uniref:EF-hand domain-containing protein n=1 Tax=Collybiopsis luxurians FD-317 M1 TaxID=944289 RepID=A0A0D0CHS5_9AGAR|nr:hypothetical protein GYMLUDRAFT_48823 [Collybiopsis luxurians FD-317 M1]